MDIRPGEQYTLRRKVFQLVGKSFRILDPNQKVVAFCRQKAFRFKEDLRLYTDESQSTELLRIQARSVIDFSATYDVKLPDGVSLGSFRRKGLASTFVRDAWRVFDASGKEIAKLEEEGSFVSLLRRYVDFVAFFFPQTFILRSDDGREIAHLRQHFNPFVYRLGISVKADDDELDDLMILAAASLIAAIEGRQG